MQSVLTSVLAPARQRTEGFQQKTQNKKTLGDKTASSVLCLPPDVLFRDEFTSLHSAGDLYRPCLNKWGFSSAQCKDKDRRRRKLFAIWSINKNANSGKPFLRSDNGGVVSVAPRDGETDGPARRHHPEFFIFKLKHSDWREERGIHLSLHTLFLVKIICFCGDSGWGLRVCRSINRPKGHWKRWCLKLRAEVCIEQASFSLWASHRCTRTGYFFYIVYFIIVYFIDTLILVFLMIFIYCTTHWFWF